MKRVSLACLLSLLVPPTLQGQDSNNFFPHHLGDLWEYFYWDGIVTGTIQDRIISDSIDDVGNSSLRMSRITRIPGWPQIQIPWYDEYKVDTLGSVFAIETYGYNRLLYKHNAQLGDVWIAEEIDTSWYNIAKLGDVRQNTIFGITTTVKGIWYFATGSLADTTVWLSQYADALADGFGVIRRGGGDLGYELYLIGAYIGGTLYGDTTIVAVKQSLESPQQVELLQNYPNPFNPKTIITYAVPRSGHVSLKVFDILGRAVYSLVDALQGPGRYQVTLDGSDLASGVYLYRLDASGSRWTRKMILQR